MVSDGHDEAVLRIGCDDCVMAASAACDDCLVTYVCSVDEPRAVVLDLDELRAIRALQVAGLVPPSRHRAASG